MGVVINVKRWIDTILQDDMVDEITVSRDGKEERPIIDAEMAVQSSPVDTESQTRPDTDANTASL